MCGEIKIEGDQTGTKKIGLAVSGLRHGYKKQMNQASTPWLMVEADERLTHATKENAQENARSER